MSLKVHFNKQGLNKVVAALKKPGGVGVLPTDTLYGIVGRAFDKKAVTKIYRLRQRQRGKPFIILISSILDFGKFKIKPDAFTKKFLSKIWPGKVSVILPCPNVKLSYLHRGTFSLAFRLPQGKNLVRLIKQTGPLVAPSANLEGKKEAKTILEARKYFGNKIDFYADAGRKNSLPSTLVKFQNRRIIVLRKGAKSINEV